MIVKMRKYSFLVYHKTYLEFLNKIREIGVLHIIEKSEGTPENDELTQKMQLSTGLRALLKKLQDTLPKGAKPMKADQSADGKALLQEIEERYNLLEMQYQKLQSAEREWERMEVWGNFSYDRLQELQEAGFDLRFFSCHERKFDPEWEVLYNAFEIDTVGIYKYFVTVNKPDVVLDIDADPIQLSDKNAADIQAEIISLQKEIETSKESIRQFAIAHYHDLQVFSTQVSGEIDFSKVVLNTTAQVDKKVMLLEGWCPEENTAQLNEYLEASGIYYESAKPTDTEKVPIKLKNNKFTKLYEMIGELYDLPNYHELDLTPFFAPFFLLFFGLCVGDTAYGLLIFIGALIMRSRVKESMKPMFSLAAWLGASTIVLGLVTGTFFGFSLIDADIPWLEKFKVFMLDSNKLFYASLIIGVVQILFGMIIQAVGKVIRYGWAASFANWGWLLIIMGMGGTFLASQVYEIDTQIVNYLYYGFGGVGAVFVFILNDIKRNPLINVGAGIWDAYNMVTGLLGDLLSYIRLFALGISSGVMGFVFNDLAFKLSGDIPVVSTLIMLVILIFGHGMNIFMAGLGAFVHPMRLTFVEFYKNAGFEGGGKKYKPFKQPVQD
jgi:V/A-type H+-transporting ATPase subunit I